MDEQELNEMGWTQRPTGRQVLTDVSVLALCSFLIGAMVGSFTLTVGSYFDWPLLLRVLPPAIAAVVAFLCFTVTFDRSRPTGIYWRLR